MISVLEGRIADAYDSRSASYPGTAVASSYDFGSIDFFSAMITQHWRYTMRKGALSVLRASQEH